jgi:hypothetical protein
LGDVCGRFDKPNDASVSQPNACALQVPGWNCAFTDTEAIALNLMPSRIDWAHTVDFQDDTDIG